MSTDDKLIALAASAAYASYSAGEGSIPESAKGIAVGASFVIPLVLPTDMESGDGRKLLADSVDLRDLPLPLLWQVATGSGHDGSYIVGRIDSLDVTENGVENVQGVFDTGPYGREAERMVRNGMLRGVSADLDKFEAVSDEEMAAMAEADPEENIDEKLLIKAARFMGCTLLAKPAFQECTIRLQEITEEYDLMDGIYEAEADYGDDAEYSISALIASGIPVAPPRAWFNNPKLKSATPLTIDEEGQVYGHIATWDQDHIGYNHQVKPPRNRSGYKYFHTGIVRTAEGEDVAVGQLTLAGGHADLALDPQAAVKHYDDTRSAMADIHVGEDSYGIWVAGALRPGVTPADVRMMRASAPSGDWRPFGSKLELVAVLQTNVPGFPIARTMVASGGQVTALVAAGAAPLYRLKVNKIQELAERVKTIEDRHLTEQKELAIAPLLKAREERNAALVASAEKIRERFSPMLAQKRQEAADLQTRADELKAQFAFLRPEYKESQHPRDRGGRWREVLGRLSELLGPDDKSGATDAVKRAADAEDNGDDNTAEEAGREAKVSLQEAIDHATGDNDLKDQLQQAVDAVDAATGQKGVNAGPDKPADEGLIEEGLRSLVEQVLDELYEKVDPESMTDRAAARLKAYVDGTGFESPEELIALISEILKKKLQPGIAQ